VNALLVLPAALRASAGGNRALSTGAATVGQAIDDLAIAWPQLERRLRDEQGAVRPHIRIYLETDDISDLSGLATPLSEGARVYIIPAVSGGC